MEEAHVHRATVEDGYVPSVGIRKYRFWTSIRGNMPEVVNSLCQGLVPTDSLESMLTTYAFRSHTTHGEENTVRGIHTIKIFGNLPAQKSLRHRMVGITLNFGGATILNRDQDATGIGAIMRTRGVNYFFHAALGLRLSHDCWLWTVATSSKTNAPLARHSGP
jgi:hypothetical protein